MEKKRRLSYRNGQGIRKQYYEKAELAEKFSTEGNHTVLT